MILALTLMERALFIEIAMKDVEREQARSRISFGLKHKGPPKAKESSVLLRVLPAESPVHDYRSGRKSLEGPLKFIPIEGETAVAQSPRGREKFHLTCVKLLIKPSKVGLEVADNKSRRNVYGVTKRVVENEATTSYAIDHGSIERKSEKSNIGSAVMNISKKFEKSREEEIQSFIKNGALELITVTEIGKETRIFGSRSSDSIKATDDGNRCKSRLVAQN